MPWTLELLRSHRGEILGIAERRGMGAVRVFGSISRGEAGETSDIDLLVQPEPGRSLLDIGGFAADLEELLGCRVDIVSERGLRPRFRDRVLHDAVAL